MKIIILIFGLAMFFPLIIQAQQADDKVIVDDTGSTNFSGYRMIIEASGQVNVMLHGKVSLNSIYAYGKYSVSPAAVKKLIDDLKTAMPLSKITAGFCAKSASFGTRTYVTYKDQTSPDIQCMQKEGFVEDVYQIMRAIPGRK